MPSESSSSKCCSWRKGLYWSPLSREIVTIIADFSEFANVVTDPLNELFEVVIGGPTIWCKGVLDCILRINQPHHYSHLLGNVHQLEPRWWQQLHRALRCVILTTGRCDKLQAFLINTVFVCRLESHFLVIQLLQDIGKGGLVQQLYVIEACVNARQWLCFEIERFSLLDFTLRKPVIICGEASFRHGKRNVWVVFTFHEVSLACGINESCLSEYINLRGVEVGLRLLGWFPVQLDFECFRPFGAPFIPDTQCLLLWLIYFHLHSRFDYVHDCIKVWPHYRYVSW